MILFTFVFGVLPSFKERITGFFLAFYFPLSLTFSRVDSLLLVQVKHRVFGFLQVFITKIKGMCKGKREDKDLKQQSTSKTTRHKIRQYS